MFTTYVLETNTRRQPLGAKVQKAFSGNGGQLPWGKC